MIKNKFSVTLLMFSFFIFFYIFYQSEIILDGRNRTYYSKYYIFSLILILFSTISFYLNKKLKSYLMMITFSGIFAIYAFQTYLTISYGGVTGQRFIEKKYKWLKKV